MQLVIRKLVAASRYDQAEAVKAESKTAYGFGSQLTAADGKKLDASYAYYLHGPLARMELGDINGKVQGVDYAYTMVHKAPERVQHGKVLAPIAAK